MSQPDVASGQGGHPGANPFLPEWEYVPDGEPHVFGDRVYLYGSHDRFGAPIFCAGDYVCWSAPVDDLAAWREEGVIYRRGQDPANRLGLRLLFAPDVARGADGRYYLFYAFDFMGTIGVAVCDSPAGRYEYLGRVHYPDGTPYGRRAGDGFAFDPAVLADDDGRVWLYSGFRTPVPALATGGVRTASDGAYVLELAPDMLTVREGQRLLMATDDPAFLGHGFFEASSIRKLDGRYVFVYSSVANHELCYATSRRPDGGFAYGGVLVSIGDVGLPGHPDEAHGTNYLGNTHGGLLRLGQRTYVFYHRQTNRSSYARQACAERLVADGRGGWLQAEVTTSGLAGTLPGVGTYQARLACNLWSADGVGRVDGPHPRRALAAHPFLTQEGRGRGARQYVANLRDGAVCGFKYLDLSRTRGIRLVARGRGAGVVEVSDDAGFSRLLGTVDVAAAGRAWADFAAPLEPAGPRSALYLRHRGGGRLDLLEFELLA